MISLHYGTLSSSSTVSKDNTLPLPGQEVVSHAKQHCTADGEWLVCRRHLPLAMIDCCLNMTHLGNVLSRDVRVELNGMPCGQTPTKCTTEFCPDMPHNTVVTACKQASMLSHGRGMLACSLSTSPSCMTAGTNTASGWVAGLAVHKLSTSATRNSCTACQPSPAL